MSILDKIKKILPKRKPPEFKNNVPKERENIRKAFGAYCKANHESKDGKLCPKCTALLTTVMLKIQRCPYGIRKSVCETCETPCFGEEATKEFSKTMEGGRKKLLLSSPMMTVKHKIAGLGAKYAKIQRQKDYTEKQKENEEKAKSKIANAFRSPKKSKSKSKKKKKK